MRPAARLLAAFLLCLLACPAASPAQEWTPDRPVRILLPFPPGGATDLLARAVAQATVVEARGKLVFVSGMLAKGPDGKIVGVGDIERQTIQVCENVKAAVEAAGGTLDDVCRVDVFVRNMEHFDVIHAVRRRYFTTAPPASTMVETPKMTTPDALIEMSAIAVVQG